MTKEKYLRANQVLGRRDGKHFCKKRVMIKAGIPSFITEETVRRILRKTVLKWTHFKRKGIVTKNDLKLRLKVAQEVYHKCSMCNYEIRNHRESYGHRESRS